MGTFPEGLTIWPVKDSQTGNTVAWAYDEAAQAVYVEFAGGATYHYTGVPARVVEDVKNSGYVSKAIANVIKKYPYKRVG